MVACYRCSACGNRTRFDVTMTRRTVAYYHYTLAGEVEVEAEDVLAEEIEGVVCRWCGAGGDAIEVLPGPDTPAGAGAG